jgi:hypothetical protein
VNKIAILLMFVVFVAGCATPRGFTRYIDHTYRPKPKNYNISVIKNEYEIERPHTVIGKIKFRVSRDSYDIMERIENRAKKMARKVGADAITNIAASEYTESGIRFIPGYTEQKLVATTYGNSYGSASVYGDINAQAYAHGQSQQNTYAYVAHPSQSIPYSKDIIVYEAEAVVFDKTDMNFLAKEVEKQSGNVIDLVGGKYCLSNNSAKDGDLEPLDSKKDDSPSQAVQSRLETLKKLYTDKLITEDEYKVKKEKILQEI